MTVHRLSLRVAWITGFLVLPGCGSASTDSLFTPNPGQRRIQNQGGSQGQFPFGTGGDTVASGAAFGSGGTYVGLGGEPNGGVGGGFGGGFGAGGFGGGGGGGETSAGGSTDSKGGALGAGGNPSGCDFSGTWASYIVAPVTWPATPAVLFAGTGSLQQWNLSEQHMKGLDVTALTVPCGIFLPDLQSDFFGGYAKFGIRFPDTLFDAGDIPQTTFVLKGKVTPTGFAFETDPFAILIGATLDNANSAPWPAAADLKLQDHDLDQKPGITVVPATGSGYSFPPCNLNFETADLIYIAERTVSSLNGTVINCNEVHSDVTIVSINGKTGINSTVIGCRKTNNAGDCVASDASFIDANRPQYEASALGTMVSVRMPDHATCKDVRNRFPKQ